MRKNFGPKAICYPMPVFIIGTYDENGIPNAMNAAWGGISDSDQITMAISPNHKTTKRTTHKRSLPGNREAFFLFWITKNGYQMISVL